VFFWSSDVAFGRRKCINKEALWEQFPGKKLGAIVGAIMPKKIKMNVQKMGFDTIMQSGDTIKIDVSEDFVPKN